MRTGIVQAHYGKVDETGLVFVAERLKNIINVSGHK